MEDMKAFVWNIVAPDKSVELSDRTVVRYVRGDDYIEVRADGKGISVRHCSRSLGSKLTVQPVVSNEIRVFIDD